MTKIITYLTAIITVLGMLLSGCANSAATVIKETQTSGADTAGKRTIHIGIQQSLGPLLVAKQKGWFEEEFGKIGVAVEWTEFQSGPPHFEAIAADRLDIGQVGNAPVIGGQAGNVDFKEIALTAEGLETNAILISANSPIKSLTDLKDKKIAVAKGSSAFNLLYRAIDSAGLKPEEVKIIQLQPDEARPAFETGVVDAWAIWDPFITIETDTNHARVLADGKTLNAYSPSFTIARTKFVQGNPDLVSKFLEVYEKARIWQENNTEEASQVLAQAKKLDSQLVKKVITRSPFLNKPIDDRIVQQQQDTADFFLRLGAIKKQIDVRQVVDNSFIDKINHTK